MYQPPPQPPYGQPPQGYPPGGYYPPPPPKQSVAKTALAVLGGIALVCSACVVFGAMGKKNQAGSPGSTAAAEQRVYIQESCSQLANKFSNRTTMTELQREEAWKAYEGKWVRWTATVNLIDRNAMGGLSLQFKCSTASLMLDGHAQFEADQQQALMRFSQGAQISFEGRLDDWGQFLGIGIEDAKVTQ